MEYKHLTFPLKLMLGYLIGILLLALLFSVSIAHISTITNDYDRMVRDTWRQLHALQTFRAAGLQLRFDVDKNPSEAKRDLRLVDYWFFNFLKSGSGDVPQDLTFLVKEFYSFRRQTLKLIDLKEKKDPKAEFSKQYNDFTKKYNILFGRIYVEIEKSKSNLEVSETQFLRRISELLFINIILAPLSFLFLYVYGFFLSNQTGLRLRKFLGSMREILSGNYKEKIRDESQDEIGQIARGMNELAKRLEGKT
ncbi:MAG: HAMP domain-containing protein [Candidatus Margulisiibacteriota bacterium]